jgi:hypothetical protein
MYSNELAKSVQGEHKRMDCTSLMFCQFPCFFYVQSLCLVEHLIKNGNERIVEETRDRLRFIRALTDFSFFEGPIDRGSGVREKAKNIIELLQDNERIRVERGKARQLREKFTSFSGHSGGGCGSSMSSGIGSYSEGGIGSSSYSEGGIGSNSFERRPPETHRSSASVGARGRYSDEGEVGGAAPPAPRHDAAAPAAPRHEPKKDKKKIDIKIKSKDVPSSGLAPPVVRSHPPTTSEPDLLGCGTGDADFGSFETTTQAFSNGNLFAAPSQPASFGFPENTAPQHAVGQPPLVPSGLQPTTPSQTLLPQQQPFSQPNLPFQQQHFQQQQFQQQQLQQQQLQQQQLQQQFQQQQQQQQQFQQFQQPSQLNQQNHLFTAGTQPQYASQQPQYASQQPRNSASQQQMNTNITVR